MRITDKINFRQPKYMLPAIVYIPLIATGYFVFDMFNTEVAETQDKNLQTTEFLNPNLPGAQIKNGDGIGGKYENMAKSYGRIADYSAVDNIERDNEEEKEAYESKYTEEDLAELVRQAEEKDDAAEVADAKAREAEALEALNKALAEARLRGQAAVAPVAQDTTQAGPPKEQIEVKGQIAEDSKAVKALDEEDKAQEVVKKVKVTSDYFNTLTQNEHEPKFIKTTLLDVKKATSMLTQHIDKIAMEIDQEKKAEQENGQGKSYLSIDDGDHAVLAYNGSAVYIQHHEKEDSVKIAVPTSNGLEVKLSVPYDHGKDLDTNYQEAFAQYKSLTEPSQSKENVYYASIAYLQSTDDTSELDKLKEKGDYQGLLTLAKEYYDGNGMDEEQTYRKPCQNRGDDLLIEDKDFAVVYNGSVGGTYEVFLKHTEQEVRDHITRYGIGRASEDVKAVAREMTAEEFSELAQRKMPIFQMPNGGLLNLQYNKDKDSLDVGTVTNAGLSVKHTFPFSHNHSMDANISSAYEQLLDMEEYQKEEVQEEHVAKSAFRR